MELYKDNRAFMKCPSFENEMRKSDQMLGVTQPPLEKAPTGDVIALPAFDPSAIPATYTELLAIRRSERVFEEQPVSCEQLSFMLWSAQGVQQIRGNRYAALRPVPSGGARHPFEVYVIAQRVAGLNQGLYHYLPLESVGENRSVVEFLRPVEDIDNTVTQLLVGQAWAAKAAFVLLFSCLPYRAEWRYSQAAHRVMLIDLGHVGQNVMLSAAALGLGSCCVAAYDTEKCDALIGLDGENEYTVYAIPVGVPRKKPE